MFCFWLMKMGMEMGMRTDEGRNRPEPGGFI